MLTSPVTKSVMPRGPQHFGKIDTKSWHLGWHPTGPYGTIGAACTAARLLRLTREQTMHAIGIAASEACGIQKNFGTMTKPLHCGPRRT